MVWDLTRALFGALLAGVLPGWFWATALVPSRDLAGRLVFSIGLSLALTPAVAFLVSETLQTGVSLPIALFSVAAVFLGGLGLRVRHGPPKVPDTPLCVLPSPAGLPALIPLAAALLLTLLSVAGRLPAGQLAPLVLALVLVAGASHLASPVPTEEEEPGNGGPRRSMALRYALLAGVLAVVLYRGYSGPVIHDWPFFRGDDQYQHTVMTRMTMESGETGSFMLYPPGLHHLLALISHLGGIDPLEIFPVLAPALLVLPALALYALGSRLFGWQVGVGAAALSVLLGGTYWYFEHGRYPNLISAQFLLVLALAALFMLYNAPSVRSGALFVILGSSVVLYHQVGSFYEAILLAAVAAIFLPYLLLRDRNRGLALLASFASLFVVCALYAWDTYDLPGIVAGLLGLGEPGGEGAEAVSMALGTKHPYDMEHLLTQSVTQPVTWLGLFGAILLISDRRRGGPADPFARVVLLLWCAMLFAGSRTSLSAFPDRFERDLPIPLALFGALALSTAALSLSPRLRVTALAGLAAAALALGAVATEANRSLDAASGPSPQLTMTPAVAEAGAWLREHNEGGNILATPYLDGLPSRGMLALGGYTGMQSYTEDRIEWARDIPPFGAGPLKDALHALRNPYDERTQRILAEYDVRYVVLYKRYPSVDWRAFDRGEHLYEKVFENESVVIFAPRENTAGWSLPQDG